MTTLAKVFSFQLAAYVGPASMAQIIERNRSEANPIICHSHDFCDASQIMLGSLAALGMDECSEEINSAWNTAKAARFYQGNL